MQKSSKNRHLSAIATKTLIDNRKKNYEAAISPPDVPHNIVKFGPLTAEIGSGVWGTPANFNGFCVLALLLQRCHSLEANQILHDVWPSPGLVHYLYIFGSTCPLTEFCQVQNSLCFPSLAFLLYWQRYCRALEQPASAKICSMLQGMELRNFRRGRHLHSAGRPSRWVSAHILVAFERNN